MAPAKVRVLLLDLGGTLVDGEAVLPHVPRALTALNRFRVADGTALGIALVSDFTMPQPPGDAARTEALVREYLELLAGFGLRPFFEPVDRRVTLSTQVGVRKPDRRVYEAALQRLGTGGTLTETLVITEDAGHVAACRALGMSALQFGQDFRDWLDGPLLVRRLVAARDAGTATEALRPWFAAREAELVAVADPDGPGTPGDATTDPVQVTLRVPLGNPGARTVTSTVTFDDTGRVADVAAAGTPGDAGGGDDGERATLLASLRANGQVGVGGGPLAPGVTHVETVDAAGRLVARRRRFSAV